MFIHPIIKNAIGSIIIGGFTLHNIIIYPHINIFINAPIFNILNLLHFILLNKKFINIEPTTNPYVKNDIIKADTLLLTLYTSVI